MSDWIPNRAVFAVEFPLRYSARLPSLTGHLKFWKDAFRLPRLGGIDDVDDFADWWACWNERGIAFACRVSGKATPLQCLPKRYWDGDNIRLCTDMRDARGNRRASRFCQQFYFLPTGGGRNKQSPVAGAAPIQRALKDAPMPEAGSIQVASHVTKGGYELEAIVPAASLSGFDPEEHSRIGFYLLVEDREFGQQFMTVGDDLNWHIDPSTWPTAVLRRS